VLSTNRQLVAAVRKAGLAHEYHEVSGAHSWEYWDARIREFLPLLMKRLGSLVP
jgi:S-formylglutathione hydrolase FrmB